MYVGCGETVRGGRGFKEYLRCPFGVCWGSSGVCWGPLVVYWGSVWVGRIMLGVVEGGHLEVPWRKWSKGVFEFKNSLTTL